MRKHIS